MNRDDERLMLAHYPHAILHLDADAFFASVEQALDHSLRGRPVVTGRERGIIACASYEAKARGVKRGIMLSDAKKLCPDLVILPSDYETYSLYSRRMFEILRRFTPQVEEYSIDEAFADITGVRRLFRASYEEICERIRAAIRAELDITVSIGLSVTKSLAKLCSKRNKPDGLFACPGPAIGMVLRTTVLDKVWGFGPSSVNLLQKMGLRTAADFVEHPVTWVKPLLHKPGCEIWHELRGEMVWPIVTEAHSAYASIMKGKTFTPATGEAGFVYARLLRNMETAFAKLRRHRLRARSVAIVLRHHDFRHDGMEARLSRATSSTLEAIPLVRRMSEETFLPGSRYRSTMIVLGRLESEGAEQGELFEDHLRVEKLRRLTAAVDAVNRNYGKHAVASGTRLYLGMKIPSARDDKPLRQSFLVPGETPARRLGLPRMQIAV